jgi:hypothetical protein
MGKSEQVAEHCAGIGERLSVSGNRFKALPGGFRAPEGNSKKRGASGALVPPFPGGMLPTWWRSAGRIKVCPGAAWCEPGSLAPRGSDRAHSPALGPSWPELVRVIHGPEMRK